MLCCYLIVSIPAFDFLIGIRAGIARSAKEIKIFAIASVIKKYKSIIKKKTIQNSIITKN